MNLRHAAALALVGWYLMVPPPDHPDAPLALWTHPLRYDTAEECEANRKRILENAKHGPLPLSFNREREVELASLRKCIATDDPRLKEK